MNRIKPSRSVPISAALDQFGMSGVRPFHPDREKGSALVIVLSFLVLLVGMAVAFLSLVGSETVVSASYSQSVALDKLNDSAVNLAMAQVKYATRGKGASGDDLSWASQPGAIRTYASDGSEGMVFKLYSANNMVASANNFRSDLATESVANARVDSALYADMNEPILVQDPSGDITLDSVNYRASYPIFDPGALGSVAGLAIGGGTTPPAASYNPVVSGNPAPMPVRWLYMLQNGEVVSPTGAGVVANVAGASSSNPIIGRIAFWTDDETSKVNINTASEGSFWDTPRFDGATERSLATFQPAANEFQRYPGHPSTVSLSTVFPSVNLSNAFQITPRVGEKGAANGGGSQGGMAIASSPVVPNFDRLYSSEEELFLDPNRARNTSIFSAEEIRKARFVLTTTSKAPETTLFDTPRISIWPVHGDLAVNPNSPYTTGYDRLSAFCATVPGVGGARYPFFFQRRDSTSSTEDYDNIVRNRELYAYLQALTGRDIPGFGGDFLTKYADDRDQILTQIFDYIRITNLFDDNLGGPGTAATNYAPGTPYAYTAGRLNMTDMRPGHGQVTPIRIGTTRGFGRFLTISEAALHLICTADGAIDPGNPRKAESAKPETNQQMRTYLEGLRATRGTAADQPVLGPDERVVQMAFYLETFCPANGWNGIEPDVSFEVVGLSGLTVSGSTPATPFPASADGTFKPQYLNKFWNSRAWGGTGGFRGLLARATPSNDVQNDAYPGAPVPANAADGGVYPFVSAPFLINVSATSSLSLSNGLVTVRIRQGGASGPVIQEMSFNFSGITMPVPQLVSVDMPSYTSGGTTYNAMPAPSWWGFRYRFAFSDLNPGIGTNTSPIGHPGGSGVSQGQLHGCVVRKDGDVVRSLIPSSGDARLTALRDSPPFSPVPPPPNEAGPHSLLHTLSEANGAAAIPDGVETSGRVNQRSLDTAFRNYGRGMRPDIPPDPAVVAKAALYRDWDNGMALAPDGAYINKPDEGNIYGLSTGSVPYFTQSQRSEAAGASHFSPNRVIPSPGMFGSLPSGLLANIPWKTLLFRPQRNHPGGVNPPDHLLMDLFWMPVVEPYAVSEPFATAGKVNMNYQIVPFTAIRRNTALRAALKPEKVTAVPNGSANNYKDGTTNSFRHSLNLDEETGTLRQFEETFAAGEIFRSATQICDIYLVPATQSWSNDNDAESWWNLQRLTGDNTRERPYANLYGKLTTRSNTFTVHTRVQMLQKRRNSPADRWEEGKDIVTSEYRGETVMERYIDPAAGMVDFASDPLQKLSDHARMRILKSRRFQP